MEYYEIEGGTALHGECEIKGAKNAALPVLAATLCKGGIHEIYGCPVIGDVAVIPHEVLAEARKHLYVGVYGVCADGRVIPTVRAQGPFIQPGADPSGEESLDPTLPVWAQIQQQIAGLREDMVLAAGILVTDDGNGNVTIKTGGA